MKSNQVLESLLANQPKLFTQGQRGKMQRLFIEIPLFLYLSCLGPQKFVYYYVDMVQGNINFTTTNISS